MGRVALAVASTPPTQGPPTAPEPRRGDRLGPSPPEGSSRRTRVPYSLRWSSSTKAR